MLHTHLGEVTAQLQHAEQMLLSRLTPEDESDVSPALLHPGALGVTGNVSGSLAPVQCAVGIAAGVAAGRSLTKWHRVHLHGMQP